MYIEKAICSVCFTDWQNKKYVKFTTVKSFYCPQSYVNGKHFHFVVLSYVTKWGNFSYVSKWLCTISVIRRVLRQL